LEVWNCRTQKLSIWIFISCKTFLRTKKIIDLPQPYKDYRIKLITLDHYKSHIKYLFRILSAFTIRLCFLFYIGVIRLMQFLYGSMLIWGLNELQELSSCVILRSLIYLLPVFASRYRLEIPKDSEMTELTSEAAGTAPPLLSSKKCEWFVGMIFNIFFESMFRQLNERIIHNSGYLVPKITKRTCF
jgi:hypothetical protein